MSSTYQHFYGAKELLIACDQSVASAMISGKRWTVCLRGAIRHGKCCKACLLQMLLHRECPACAEAITVTTAHIATRACCQHSRLSQSAIACRKHA